MVAPPVLICKAEYYKKILNSFVPLPTLTEAPEVLRAGTNRGAKFCAPSPRVVQVPLPLQILRKCRAYVTFRGGRVRLPPSGPHFWRPYTLRYIGTPHPTPLKLASSRHQGRHAVTSRSSTRAPIVSPEGVCTRVIVGSLNL